MILRIPDSLNYHPKQLDDVLSIITLGQEQKQALAPLLLLDELPAKEAWTKVLDIDGTNTEWEPLMIAVAHALGTSVTRIN